MILSEKLRCAYSCIPKKYQKMLLGMTFRIIDGRFAYEVVLKKGYSHPDTGRTIIASGIQQLIQKCREVKEV